ncbi:MAG TPA: MFS transporter [Flavisolibacter sp.]|jgi:MFS family permease|nr:MFS transporter [Flavisolibacter sp.]
MSDITIAIERTKRVYRIAVSTLFFLQGLCFATWASRIPSIQQQLGISESLLGVILFALPAGSMISLAFSGKLVTKYGSKKIAVNALFLYSLLLPAIGFSSTPALLITSLIFFGFAGNLANIAINTQAVHVEARYGRNIMASFHGLWSTAGFVAAGIGTFMIGKGIVPLTHFVIITGIIATGVAACLQYLITEEKAPASSAPLFVKPDKTLLRLGILAFCCMICEGAMFDWSGIYFQKVVGAEKSWIGAGYTAFMCAMASGRFVADWVSNKLKFTRTIFISGLLITGGLLLAVLIPKVLPSIIGFLVVGFGVSSVIPLIYSEAGKSKTTSAGMALTAVSSIGFLGFLIGPPLIGIIAGVFSLRISFLLIALIGLLIAVMIRYGRPAGSNN